ncbi:MAG: hypothetical protein GQ570_02865 [Helicobacteraceae bacterium]|nr:hypothetical protein [Helicobacteraceae bacterium]
MNKYFTLIFLLIILFVNAVVILSANVSGYENLLIDLTQENHLFESGTFLLLFVSGIYLIIKQKTSSEHYIRAFLIFLSLISFIAAFEEISWTQHWFEFESTEYFKENNMQQETNLHNFIPSVFFSTVIYTFIYATFILLPLLNSATQNIKLLQNRYIQILMPTYTMTLVATFAMSLQVYHIQEYIADVATTIACAFLALVVYVKSYKVRTKSELLLLLLVIASIATFMLNNSIFYITNRQYEIREFVLVFLYLVWVSNLVNRNKYIQK